MINVSLSGVNCFAPQDAAESLASMGYPIPEDFSKANSFLAVCGEDAGHGYLFMQSKDLDSLDLNALHTLTFTLISPNGNTQKTITFHNLVVCKEPLNLTPSNTANDPLSLYLVEVADSRWRVHNPLFWVSATKLYNVESNVHHGAEGPTVYLSASQKAGTITGATNATPIVITSTAHGLLTGAVVVITEVEGNTEANGTWTITVINSDSYSLDTSVGDDDYTAGGSWTSPWTWTSMIGDLWELVAPQVGAYPDLPVAPDGTPIGWIFQGVSAWGAVNQLLHRIGCTVRPNLTESSAQFTIVKIGVADTASDTIIAAAEAANLKIYDGEFKTLARGILPYGVKVLFHKQYSSPTGVPPWLLNLAPYELDVVGPDSTITETGVFHPIWDDLPALYNDVPVLTNLAALTTRAAERSADFFLMNRVTGDGRYWKRYSGIVTIAPGSTIKLVAWKNVGTATNAEELFTDIVRRPMGEEFCAEAKDYTNAGTAWDLVRLGFPTAGPGPDFCAPLTNCPGETKYLHQTDGVLALNDVPCDDCWGSGSGSVGFYCGSYDDTEAGDCGTGIPGDGCDGADNATALEMGISYGPFLLNFPDTQWFRFVTDHVSDTYNVTLTWVSGGKGSGRVDKGDDCNLLQTLVDFSEVPTSGVSSCVSSASFNLAHGYAVISTPTSCRYTVKVSVGVCT